MYLKNLFILIIILILALGTMDSTFAVVSPIINEDNIDQQSTANVCKIGGGDLIELLGKFKPTGWGLLGAAIMIYDHLPPRHKKQVDSVFEGFWKYLCMKNKGDFTIITKLKFGLYP